MTSARPLPGDIPAVRAIIWRFADASWVQGMLALVGLGVVAPVKRSTWSLAAEGIITKRVPRRLSYQKGFTPQLLSVCPAPYGARVRFMGLVGQDLRQWQNASLRLASAIGVPTVVVTEPEPMVFELALRVLDPIGQPVQLTAVPPADSWSLRLGQDEFGEVKQLSLSNVAGVVVGGLPGAGKSAWLSSTLAGFVSSPAVQYVVIDGKGGQDLSCLQQRCCRFVNDDLDIEAVAAVLSDVVGLTRSRIRNAERLFGSSNFWHRGPTVQVPLVFVVIDECQTFLDPRQLITKDRKAIGAEIHASVNYLVRKGRSAGIVTVVATQKPTADSLPTDIRDNAAMRICFGVQSTHAATAVLGDDWRAGESASPLGAPAGVGVAAVNSRFIRFRAPYVHESAVARYTAAWAVHRRDPWELSERALGAAGIDDGGTGKGAGR